MTELREFPREPTNDPGPVGCTVILLFLAAAVTGVVLLVRLPWRDEAPPGDAATTQTLDPRSAAGDSPAVEPTHSERGAVKPKSAVIGDAPIGGRMAQPVPGEGLLWKIGRLLLKWISFTALALVVWVPLLVALISGFEALDDGSDASDACIVWGVAKILIAIAAPILAGMWWHSHILLPAANLGGP